jgi:hypothetical protein
MTLIHTTMIGVWNGVEKSNKDFQVNKEVQG